MNGAIELVSEDLPQPVPEVLPAGAVPEEVARSMKAALHGLRLDLVELISRKLDKSNELRTDLAAIKRELAFVRKALAGQSARIIGLEKKAGIHRQRRGNQGPRLPERKS